MNYGTIKSVNGQIVEVEFKKAKPKIRNLLVLDGNPDVRFEVFASSGPNAFYCLALSRTESLFRDAKIIDTGSPVVFPTGSKMLGRVVDI